MVLPAEPPVSEMFLQLPPVYRSERVTFVWVAVSEEQVIQLSKLRS